MQPKILLADDSPVIQSLTRKILESQGYAFTGVKRGELVLPELEKGTYDLLILDILLPDMNGMELAKKIRESDDKFISKLPIIGISGNYGNYSAADFEAAGMNNFFLKPINYDELLASVKQLTGT